MKNTRSNLKWLMVVAVTIATAIGCKKDSYVNIPNTPDPAPNVEATFVNASGNIKNALEQFRHMLGDSLNTKPNADPTGRREVNWDAVPAGLTNNANFPFDFFNSTDPDAPAGRKRGLLLLPASDFRVDSSNFSEIDANYVKQFQAFSPKRTFISLGTNITMVSFRVPGSSVDATVKGFGVIFSDVDVDFNTTVEYFNGNKSLGVFSAPKRSDPAGFSFVGVFFPNDLITSVKITAGNGSLAQGLKDVSDGGYKDLVVMDDFLYSEPKPIKVAL